MERPLISVVSPVYAAEAVVERLVAEIIRAVTPITQQFEIILVEDRGPDNSWQKIRSLCAADSRVKGIRLSRNFGQHYAITAGLDKSRGEWVVVMDCDLQDRPDQIVHFYNKALEGYQVVQGRRVTRQDNFFKRSFSWLFYKMLA